MDNYLQLGGQKILVKREMLHQANLKFYPENPRIYSYVNIDGLEPPQQEIESKLTQLDNVKRLLQSIKANGGLIDPIIVQEETCIVFEGNSRLAAYRLLALEDPIKWGKVLCTILPKDIDEKLIFNLLGQYHIIGRTDWAPFEQAGYLWRRHTKHNVKIDNMSKELGISPRKAQSFVDVYSFMISKNDLEPQHWSYYEEYLKSNKIKQKRSEFPKFDDTFVKKVKNGEIEKAVLVRDMVAKIASVGGKTLKKFINEEKSLKECYDIAKDKGVDNRLYNKFYNFRLLIVDQATKKELQTMNKNQLDKCRFELKKILKGTEKILAKIDN